MKVHHVAHYEYGSRPHSEMREKEFLNNETKEVTFVDIIDEPTEVSSLLVQSAVNEIRYRKG